MKEEKDINMCPCQMDSRRLSGVTKCLSARRDTVQNKQVCIAKTRRHQSKEREI